MSTSNSWLGKDVEFINSITLFNEIVKLDGNAVDKLAVFLIAPPITASTWFSDAQNWLTSLRFYPFDVGLTSPTSRTGKLEIGVTLAGEIETDIDATEMTNPYWLIHMGEHYYSPRFTGVDSFANYNGYTKVKVWLPYVGFIDLNPNDIIDKYIQFRLKVDYYTGHAVYYVGVSTNSCPPLSGSSIPSGVLANEALDANIRILSTISFQLGYDIPINASNALDMIRNLIGGSVKGVVSGVASSITKNTSETDKYNKTEYVQKTRNNTTGRLQTQGSFYSSEDTKSVTKSHRNQIPETAETSVDLLNNLHIGTTGDRVNNPIMLSNGSQSIKIVTYSPNIIGISADYGKLYGYPIGMGMSLSVLTGFTVVSNVHIEGEDFERATLDEINEIHKFLLDGVIL